MADVRVNGKRIPPLQSVDDLMVLIRQLESLAVKEQSALTSLLLNNVSIDIDNAHYHKLKLENEDKVEARIDSPEQLSFESLQVAQDMAELLLFDLKVAAVHIWDEKRAYEKSIETLLNDCSLFLSLGSRPLYLLNKNLNQLEEDAQNCLKELDKVANHVEDAVLLTVHGKVKDACYVLVGMVKPAIERWLGLSAIFAQSLCINQVSNKENDDGLQSK